MNEYKIQAVYENKIVSVQIGAPQKGIPMRETSEFHIEGSKLILNDTIENLLTPTQ